MQVSTTWTLDTCNHASEPAKKPGIKPVPLLSYHPVELKFEQVVNRYYGTLYRFAYSLTRNEAEACDLAQETCYIWATKGYQLRDATKLKSWLFTTLHREYLSARRHEVRFPHHEVSSVAHELPPLPPEVVDRMDGGTVMQTLLQVDEIYRTPLMLFYLEDLSYKEIAETLDVAIGTVMSRLARGKERLRELLAVRDFSPSTHTERIMPLESS
jgi:RNA polymerase sigma-70 factor (ECF subfamily)